MAARHANAGDSRDRFSKRGRKAGQSQGFSQESSRNSASFSAKDNPSSKRSASGFRPAYTPGTQGYAANSAFSRQAAANHYSRNSGQYAARKPSRSKKIAIVLSCVLIITLVGAGVAFAWVNNVNRQLNMGDKSQAEIDAINAVLEPNADPAFKEPFYMMLIGTDLRSDVEDDVGRSDTNIVVRVDPGRNQATLVSIPRDTKIDIDGYGTNKFNAAYTFEGAKGAISAANDLLDIKISHYAEVNFDSLKALVDSVGGVDIEVEELVDDPDADGTSAHPEWPRVIIQPGMQHLDGNQALVFARSRAYADGDFTRTANQRKLIMAIVNKVLELPPSQLPAVVDAASKCVTTDLKIADILALVQQFKDEGELTVYSALLPSTTAMIDGVSYVINDTKQTKEMMRIIEEGGDPSEIVATATSIEDSSSSNSLSGSSTGTMDSGNSNGVYTDPGYNTGNSTGYYDYGSTQQPDGGGATYGGNPTYVDPGTSSGGSGNHGDASSGGDAGAGTGGVDPTASGGAGTNPSPGV